MNQDAYRVKSAMRVIDILELVAAAPNGVSFSILGESLGIPKSSLFHLLGTLCHRNYLRQREDKHYELGLRARAFAAPKPRDLAQTAVERVQAASGLTTSYMERRGDEAEIVISRLGTGRLLPVQTVGQRAPLHVFSGGKLMLATLADDELDDYLARVPLAALTPHTVITAHGVRKDIAEVRRTGIGMCREEQSIGIIGISVPLHIGPALIGTIGVALAAPISSESDIRAATDMLGTARAEFERATELLLPSRDD